MAQAHMDIEGESEAAVFITKLYLAKSFNCNKKIASVGFKVRDFGLTLQLRDERNKFLNLTVHYWGYMFFNNKNELWSHIQSAPQ